MSSPEPDPQVGSHAAIEEIRYLSGHNVIAAIGAQITELKAEMKAEFTKVNARIDAQTSRIESIESRINDLRRVIWPALPGCHCRPWLGVVLSQEGVSASLWGLFFGDVGKWVDYET